MDLDGLTPGQRRVAVDLMALGATRPTFDPDLPVELRDALESGVADLAESLGVRELSVNKRRLAQIHACERHQVAEQDAPFEWSSRTAAGTLAHRAVELAVFVDTDLAPLDLVDEAVARIEADADDRGLGAFLRGASAVERADLRAGANERVVRFLESFPPLSRRWSPRLESPVRVDLCDERIVLRGKYDLALGRAQGTEARVLIVDFKTGDRHGSHLDDLRFYALLETIRNGIPPFRVATYYFDSSNFCAEDVTTETLAIALRRTVDGVRAIAELHLRQREARFTPGPTCSWCRLRDECDGARAWREARAEIGA